jgi:hypothetical protein
MRKRISTLALVAALVAVAFVSLPSEVLAQYGHGHGYRYGYSHGYYDYGYGGYGPYGYGTYRSNDGDVRIEVGPKYLRAEAHVYVNDAHVGDVDDFDGFFQRLSLSPGEYDIEIRLDGYQTLKTRIFVRRGSTYKIREALTPIVAN